MLPGLAILPQHTWSNNRVSGKAALGPACTYLQHDTTGWAVQRIQQLAACRAELLRLQRTAKQQSDQPQELLQGLSTPNFACIGLTCP